MPLLEQHAHWQSDVPGLLARSSVLDAVNKYKEDRRHKEDHRGEPSSLEEQGIHSFPLADVNEAFAQAEWADRQTTITRAVLVP